MSSILFGAFALRRTIELLRAQDQALAVARGALSDVIDRQFQSTRYPPTMGPIAVRPPVMAKAANQMMVSRMAGPLLRCISSFMRLRGIGAWYHWAETR